MNKLQSFSHRHFGEILIVQIDGKEWFAATQVALVLGYSNPHDAVNKHCRKEGVAFREVLTPGGAQSMKFINEGNLYRLIARSRLPNAEQFERWVFDEVLPSIRKHGMYATDELLNNPDFMIEVFQKLKEERNARIAAEQQIESEKPLVLFAESLQVSHDSILVADLAKLLKQNDIEFGEIRLFKWLRENGYLIKSGSEYNMPTQRSMEMKLFEIKIGSRNSADGTVKITRTPKVTTKGQLYFINKFKKELVTA